MSNKTLGVVETRGLVGTIEAVDTMVKTVNMAPIGYEGIGSGLATVMIRRDVGAVKASVDVSATAAANVGQVVSQHIIPRPHTDVEKILPKSLQDASKRIPVSVAGIQTSGRG